MFPTHMSMIHEAMAGRELGEERHQAQDLRPDLPDQPGDAAGLQRGRRRSWTPRARKLVKKADVSISETSMSSHVLAMRAANPEHIIHYVINPATMAKFMVESAQQNYYPPKGISGNHLAAEVLGSIFGKHPAGRYWTNTTYKLWGPEFMATMNKYARGNQGIEPPHRPGRLRRRRTSSPQAAKAVGPNLTRERLMAAARQRHRVAVRRLAGPEVLLRPVRAHRQQLEQAERPGPGVHVQVHLHQHRRPTPTARRPASRPTRTSS